MLINNLPNEYHHNVESQYFYDRYRLRRVILTFAKL